MDDQVQKWIRVLENEWDRPDGFLGKLREGTFDPRHATIFVGRLTDIKLSTSPVIDRRLVSLLWYIPIFLVWQRERIQENGGDLIAFERLINQVQGILENLLGVP
jgi:hypothetical protein